MISESIKKRYFGYAMIIFWIVYALVLYSDSRYFVVCTAMCFWASWNVFAYFSNKYMIGIGLISGLVAGDENRILLLLLSVILYLGSVWLYFLEWRAQI